MHALTAVAAGVRGSENGFLKVYTLAGAESPCYSDILGTVQSQAGDGIALDAFGGAVVYVRDTCEIVARDSTGAEVRRWVDIVGAEAVEVVSPSFTGRNYNGGSEGVSKPVDLLEVLGRWFTSAAAPDFEVNGPDLEGDPTGTDTSSLEDISALLGLMVVVDSYGAVGDGVTDDTAAINQAILVAQSLADANGGPGTLVFRPKNYRITASLALPPHVHVMGNGATLTLDAAAESAITLFGGAAAFESVVSDLAFVYSQANSTTTIVMGSLAAQWVKFQRCKFSDSNRTGSVCVSTVAISGRHRIEFESCLVRHYAAANTAFTANDSTFLRLTKNQIIKTASAYNAALILGRNLRMQGNTVDLSAVTSGTYWAVSFIGTGGTGPTAVVWGNEFIAGSGTSGVFLMASGLAETTTDIREWANLFGTAWTAVYDSFGSGSVAATVQCGSRVRTLQQNSAAGGATLALTADYLEHAITITASGNLTLTCGNLPPGAELIVYLRNTSGGATGTVTFGSGFKTVAAGTAPTASLGTNNTSEMWVFKAVIAGANYYWALVATSAPSELSS